MSLRILSAIAILVSLSAPLLAARTAVLDNGLVCVTFHLDTGAYDIKMDKGVTVVSGARASMNGASSADAGYERTARMEPLADDIGTGRRMIVTCVRPNDPSLLIEFREYTSSSRVVIREGISNVTGDSIRVHSLHPLAGGRLLPGTAWSDVKTLNGDSGACDTQVKDGVWRICANSALLTLRQGSIRRSLVLGGLATSDFCKYVHFFPEGSSARMHELAAVMGPGTSLAAYCDSISGPWPASGTGASLIALNGVPYTFPNAPIDSSGPAPLVTELFDNNALRYRGAGLDPAKDYVLGFSWWDGDSGGRMASITAIGSDGKQWPIMARRALPHPGAGSGLPGECALAVPRGAYRDGVCTFTFSHEKGANVVVSEVWLWQAASIPAQWQEPLSTHVTASAISTDTTGAVADLEESDPVGRLVDRGETYLSADSFMVDAGIADPFSALESYGRTLRLATHAHPHAYDFPTVCAWYAGVWRTPGAQNHPGKSRYLINTTPGLVQEAAMAKASGFLHYSRMAGRLVPDTYQADNPQGWWDDAHWRLGGYYVAPRDSSMSFGKGMHDLGCLAFTYFQPNHVSEDFARLHPDWLVGKNPGAALDWTTPAVQSYMKTVFAAMRGGIDGVMYDYCDDVWGHNAVVGGFFDPHATATSYYRKLFQLTKQGLGPDSWVHERNIGSPNNDLTVGLADLERTSGDTDKITPQLVSRGGLRWYKDRVVMNYDMDSKDLTSAWKMKGWTGSDEDGRRMTLTMSYVAASRLLLAQSFRDLTPEQLHDLSRVFPYPTAPHSARPIDAFCHEGCPRVYADKVTGDWLEVALYNNTIPTCAQTLSVPLSVAAVDGGLDLDPNADYYIYDFWNDSFSGRLHGSGVLSQTLRPGEARVLSVHRVLDHPQFLSTNRHISQGQLDMESFPKWDASAASLSGVSKVVGAEAYRIVIALNRRKIAKVVATGAAAHFDLSGTDPNLATLTLKSSTDQAVAWSIRFRR